MIPNMTLPNGVEIPTLGFGTYKVTENVEPIVASAIEVGFRHIDTAQMYGNEAEVGRAWTGSGISRGDFFLTSKLDNPNHEPYLARRSFEQTLKDLQTDYVDLFLIHWPLPSQHVHGYADIWQVMEEFYEAGLARAIGVSNFYETHLNALLRDATIKPHVDQIESHPYLPQISLHNFCSENGVVVEAWSPLARGRVVQDPQLVEIGSAHDKSAVQVAIRWGLQRGDILFPKASNGARQQENMDVFDFELSPAEMSLIDALDEGESGRTGSHPDKKA
jgi:Aldo/keto reductases, related to diketogulonate reductase